MTNSTSSGLKPIKDLWSDEYEYGYERRYKLKNVCLTGP
jgi:hypothetical protein